MQFCSGKSDCVVKCCTDKSQADAFVQRLKMATEALRHCPASTKRGLAVAKTYVSQIEKVGKLANKKRLRENGYVIVQMAASSQKLCTAFCLSQESRRNSHNNNNNQQEDCDCDSDFSSQLRSRVWELVRKSYELSQGQSVIGKVKGWEGEDDNGNTVFTITSVTVHSRRGEFGHTDQGVAALQQFELRADIQHQPTPTTRLCPSAPPLTSEVSVDFADEDNNVFFPNPQPLSYRQKQREIFPVVEPTPQKSLLKSDAFSSTYINGLIQSFREQLAMHPQARSGVTEDVLNAYLGQPPSYSD
jgi:hypothetical protein